MRRKRKRLGEMLVEGGLLTDAQLQEVLAGQRGSGLKLGEYIIQQGILKEAQIVDVVSQQLLIDKYHPSRYPFDVNLASALPAEFAVKNQLVPLRKKGNLLTVAMVDPMDINALDSAEIITNLEVEPIICTDQEAKELIFSIYGIRADSGQSVQDYADAMAVDATGEAESDADAQEIHSLADMAEEAPVVKLVNTILTQAVREKASDIHISPEQNYVQLRFRVDGKLREVPAPPKTVFLPIISRLKILANMDIAVSRIPQDGRFSFSVDNREVHVRASTLPTVHGENMVMRLLDRSAGALTLDDLGFAKADMEKIQTAITKPWGMILATGPTGSGKSTTLYAILRTLNTPDTNIITLEDPVEYRIEKIRQVQLNRKAGMTFASGLRSILRQDPDTLMVGEIRDGETADIAVESALTGHRLLSTLHTNDSASAVTRLIEMGVEPYLVSSTLLVSIAQRLVRRICPHCKQEHTPNERLVRLMGLSEMEGARYYTGTGCFRCNDSGYQGRVGIYEILDVDDTVQDMIVRRASAHEITREVVSKGKLKTLKQSAAEKVLAGVTSLEEAAGASLV